MLFADIEDWLDEVARHHAKCRTCKAVGTISRGHVGSLHSFHRDSPRGWCRPCNRQGDWPHERQHRRPAAFHGKG